MDQGTFERYLWAKAFASGVISKGLERNYYHFVNSDNIESMAPTIEKEKVDEAVKRAKREQKGFAEKPLVMEEIVEALDLMDRSLKVHLCVGSPRDRIHAFRALMDHPEQVQAFGSWKMRQIMAQIGGLESPELADFVFYFDMPHGSDGIPTIKQALTILSNVASAHGHQEGKVVRLPRYSVRVGTTDGQPVHPAVSIAQGQGRFKEYLADLHPNILNDRYLEAVNNALTQKTKRQLGLQQIVLKEETL